MKVATKGRRYTIDGVRQPPREFVARDAFKLMNNVIRWAKTGNQKALSRAERWIEFQMELGIKMLRAPREYTFWRHDPKSKEEDFWDTPRNHHHVVDLRQKPGGTFRLSRLERKVLRKQVRLGLKHGIVFDIPHLWTIKHYEGGMGDPRTNQLEANIWNEHYLAAVGRQITKLRKQFGSVPFLNEIANEFNTVHPALNTKQIGDMCVRWHKRDAYEIIGIDQAGPPVDPHRNEVPYIPKLKDGARSPDDIRLHPHRSYYPPMDWWQIGPHVEKYFKQYRMPIYIDEPILLMPAKAYDALPKGHGWRWLGTKRKQKYADMCEDLWSRGFYVCIHDGGSDSGSIHGGGVSATWVPGFNDKPGSVDDFIKELLS
jgi:hypothetical protein